MNSRHYRNDSIDDCGVNGGCGIDEMKPLLVLSPFSVAPARFGGSIRVFHLLREVARHREVKLFSQQVGRLGLRCSLSPLERELAPGWVEHASRNPFSIGHFAALSLFLHSPPIGQTAVLQASAPRWLRKEIARAAVVQVEHPWQFCWAYEHRRPACPIIYSAHNVEADLAECNNHLPRPFAKLIRRVVEREESFAVAKADRIVCVSEEDAARLIERYGVHRSRIEVVFNGVDCTAIRPASGDERITQKRDLGLEGTPVVLFSGSSHPPNVDAAHQILTWAQQAQGPDVLYLIVGGVGRALPCERSDRIRITGPVPDMRPYFQASDLAINPVTWGSGSNLKQLEYLAAGLPSVTTQMGARGLSLTPSVHALVESLEAIPQRLAWLLRNPDTAASLARAGRQLVERHFDWPILGCRLNRMYDALD